MTQKSMNIVTNWLNNNQYQQQNLNQQNQGSKMLAV